ncbi:hypothetical protein DFR67_11280 [Williamsia limnetica]|uniref:Uncharacterized protein n=1 Tax=Williamsia limnetica TaxID=882452 RepID=A0A318RKK3_WILLI|nr:hypothetical protein [Williamsia limnetica]PYE14619.1 hypothetical protein DFR67_11280 [Williamsia limnetica]
MSRFSPTLALVGIGAALVAVWGLLGAPDLNGSAAGPWIILGITVVVGLALIFSGGRGKGSDVKKSTPTSPPDS